MKKPGNYDHSLIEKKWQKKWSSKKVYRSKEDKKKQKYYILDMFPYPSGEGLHVGHPKGYIATDVVSRYQRMNGKSVLHPMGFDAFGLPAENYALKTKTNPADSVQKNVDRYKKQLEILGLDYDWSREINTTDPKYYKWTQWIFLQMFKKGLAYESFEPINWCPSCKTGLANEDVEDGRCERCGTLVEKKPMRQWVLKITDYAERLLKDLDASNEVKMVERIGGHDGVQPGMPFKERNAVVCIIKHWSEDKYLCVDWKASGWKGFVIGGIEKGEDAGMAGAREITEETGFKNVKFINDIGKVDAKFFHLVKKENRHAHFTGSYFELTNGEMTDVSEEEKALQDIKWISKNDVRKFLTHADMVYLWDLFTGKEKQNIGPMLDWPKSIKELQRNWIGKSEGAILSFKLKTKTENKTVEVFTTRPDTLFGVTYVVLAPENKLVAELLPLIGNKNDVEAYINKSKSLSEIERTDATKEKTGVELKNIKAINPATNEEVPVYIADYVLADYGTGAVMAVPAHDERDFEFAKKYKLAIRPVIHNYIEFWDEETNKGNFRLGSQMTRQTFSLNYPEGVVRDERLLNSLKAQAENDINRGKVVYESGILFDSGEFTGMNSEYAKSKIANKYGIVKTTYKLRDWVFSRQRYWGEPIPLIHCATCGVVAVPEKDLPVKLPRIKSYEPTGTGESPLAAIEKWVNVKCPKCRGEAKRETNTMPQWAGSSWYYLRYMDPKNKKVFADSSKEKYWAPVDLYVGGAEHATRHLIYARFWHKFLYDIGAVSTIEPFTKLQSVGLIMGEDGRKMGKRFGNVVNPDDIVNTYGADTLRVYEMFMGPFDQEISWNTDSIIGSRRFIEKIWKLSAKVSPELNNVPKIIHKTIKKVSEDIESLRFNTAISSLMIAVNEVEKSEKISLATYSTILKLLSPFAPHVSDELWGATGGKGSIHVSAWPNYEQSMVTDDEVNIIVQINGKTRSSFTTKPGETKEKMEEMAKSANGIEKWLKGAQILKIVVVPGRLVNIVLHS